MERVRALRDALYAECRDCGSTFDDLHPYWGIGTLIAMHNHKNADGTWRKSGGLRRCILYGYPH